MNLQEMQDHFIHLYGRRNRIFLRDMNERICFLILAVADLQEAIRKNYNQKILEIALSRIVARIFCIAEYFYSLPLTMIFSQKYPATYCSYCKKTPCICSEERPNSVLSQAPEIQLIWSLKEWQNHLNILYGDKNRDKNMEYILNRLFKETTEILVLQMMTSNTKLTCEEIEKAIALELADVLAWVIAVANFLEIDLEKAVLDRFGEGCWKCRQNPCVCVGFVIEPVKWKELFL